MTQDELQRAFEDELSNIAPEADLTHLDPNADLREALDIDSMDFLNLMTALHRRLGINVPEVDYSRLFTLKTAVAYLQEKLALS
jgi:acyl carrier protein